MSLIFLRQIKALKILTREQIKVKLISQSMMKLLERVASLLRTLVNITNNKHSNGSHIIGLTRLSIKISTDILI